MPSELVPDWQGNRRTTNFHSTKNNSLLLLISEYITGKFLQSYSSLQVLQKVNFWNCRNKAFHRPDALPVTQPTTTMHWRIYDNQSTLSIKHNLRVPLRSTITSPWQNATVIPPFHPLLRLWKQSKPRCGMTYELTALTFQSSQF